MPLGAGPPTGCLARRGGAIAPPIQCLKHAASAIAISLADQDVSAAIFVFGIIWIGQIGSGLLGTGEEISTDIRQRHRFDSAVLAPGSGTIAGIPDDDLIICGHTKKKHGMTSGTGPAIVRLTGQMILTSDDDNDRFALQQMGCNLIHGLLLAGEISDIGILDIIFGQDLGYTIEGHGSLFLLGLLIIGLPHGQT